MEGVMKTKEGQISNLETEVATLTAKVKDMEASMSKHVRVNV